MSVTQPRLLPASSPRRRPAEIAASASVDTGGVDRIHVPKRENGRTRRTDEPMDGGPPKKVGEHDGKRWWTVW